MPGLGAWGKEERNSSRSRLKKKERGSIQQKREKEQLEEWKEIHRI